MDSIKKKYPRFAEAIVKIFAVMGLVIILMIAIYGALAALRSIPNVWDSIGNAFTSVTRIFTGDDELKLSTDPQTLVSGQEFRLNFRGRNLLNGKFEFSYECVDGVNFEIISPVDETHNFVFCNTETSFAPDNNGIRLVASLVNTETATVPVHVAFTADGKNDVTSAGELTLTILQTADTGTATTTPNGGTSGGNKPATTTPPVNRPTVPNMPKEPGNVFIPGAGTPVLYGDPDLAVAFLDSGVVNRSTGLYTPGVNVTASDLVGFRFEVINLGTNRSGAWRWNAVLPTESSYKYTSMPQQSLNPGDRIQYTVAFEGIRPQSTNQIVVIADPDNDVRESNESNNQRILNIFMAGASDSAYTLPLSSDCDRNGSTYTCYENNYKYTSCERSGSRYVCESRRRN